MEVKELRKDLHKMIDEVEDKILLETLFQFLGEVKYQYSGEIWNSLVEEEKNQVYLSLEESQNEENLVSWESIRNKPI